jgi:hypothetical protein
VSNFIIPLDFIAILFCPKIDCFEVECIANNSELFIEIFLGELKIIFFDEVIFKSFPELYSILPV